jgi:AcrR family transcriptional regulator
MDSRDALLAKVLDFTARDGIADRSLCEIATGAGTSHRMLLYHFGSREGLLAAIVAAMEARQRASMAELAATVTTPQDLMSRLWEQVSSPELRPFVRLFFEVFALTRADLTTAWIDDAMAVASKLGVAPDPAATRLGVAVSRGLLLDLLAGADKAEADAAYDLFVRMSGQAAAEVGLPGRAAAGQDRHGTLAG